MFQYKQNIQSLEKFRLVINKQKENATYLLDCLNKLSGTYLQKCLEFEAASRQRKALLQSGRLHLLRHADSISGEDLSEDDSVVKMEAELSRLEIKKYWYVRKIQQAKEYIAELRGQDDGAIVGQIRRQEALQKLDPVEAEQIRRYYREQSALVSILQQCVVPLLDAQNTGALELLFRNVVTALQNIGQ